MNNRKKYYRKIITLLEKDNLTDIFSRIYNPKNKKWERIFEYITCILENGRHWSDVEAFIIDRMNLKRQDMGIDVIIYDKEEIKKAIQVKLYLSKKSYIGFRQIGTFFVCCSPFPNIIRTLYTTEKPIISKFLENNRLRFHEIVRVNQENIDFINKKLEKYRDEKEIKTIYKNTYHEKIIKKIRKKVYKSYKNNEKSYILKLPCGWKNSYYFTYFQETYKNKKRCKIIILCSLYYSYETS